MTSSHAVVSGLTLYPIKSCLAVAQRRVWVGEEGLQGDRRFMVVKPDGSFVTARTHPQLQQVSVELLPVGLRLQAPGLPAIGILTERFVGQGFQTQVWQDSFVAWTTHPDYDDWFSRLLGEPVRLLWLGLQSERYRAKLGQRVSFADGYPLLLIGEAALSDLNGRMAEPQRMSQFRPNLVFRGGTPFAEDGWRRIRVGEVEFLVAKPCSRCVMTTLDAQRGEYHPLKEPLATLATYRMGEDGEIYFGQNLQPLNEGWIQLGDAVEVLETQAAPVYAPKPRMVVADAPPAGDRHRVTVGETQLTVRGDATLLDQLEDAGLDWPYSCRSGFCGHCRRPLLSGSVTHQPATELAKHLESKGEVLPCCAYATGDLALAERR
ncbi:YcbX family protein [Pseudaeromonas sp. ZJS20]|uniref:YcbX family protein n=1 Tax=Pseudaeromonas aegiceratis TaxID=3153928 RepID=UPI00390CBDBC